jgi:hypothetical protein
MSSDRILMHDFIVYRGKDYKFAYYSKVLGKAVIYLPCERHGDHYFVVEISEVARKYPL